MCPPRPPQNSRGGLLVTAGPGRVLAPCIIFTDTMTIQGASNCGHHFFWVFGWSRAFIVMTFFFLSCQSVSFLVFWLKRQVFCSVLLFFVCTCWPFQTARSFSFKSEILFIKSHGSQIYASFFHISESSYVYFVNNAQCLVVISGRSRKMYVGSIFSKFLHFKCWENIKE